MCGRTLESNKEVEQHEQCIVLYDGTRAPDQAEELTVVTLPDLLFDTSNITANAERSAAAFIPEWDRPLSPRADTPFKIPIQA